MVPKENSNKGGPTVQRWHPMVQLTVPLQRKSWLTKAWVGHLRDLAVFDRLEEELMWSGGTKVKPKCLGGDMVLLMGLGEEKAVELCREDVDSGLPMFHSLKKWSLGLKTRLRLVWVACWGIPLHAWDILNSKKIVECIGDVVDLEEVN